MASNRERIQVLLSLIEKGVEPYVVEKLEGFFGASWRHHARLPNSLSPMADLDAYACLYALIHNWRDVFQNVLKPAARDAASAALAGRNAFSHSSSELDEKVTLRALSGGEEILSLIGAKQEAEIARQHFDALQQSMVVAKLKAEGKLKPDDKVQAKGSSEKPSAPELKLTSPKASAPQPQQGDLLGLGGGDVEGLKPWRTVMPPREDVLTGRLNKDSFAANLAVVDRSYRTGGVEGAYTDPLMFFESTHLTRGLQMVLDKAGRRFVGGDAPSTIGLQTNFGGGKTHTLLALLHMAKLGDLSKSEVLSPISETLGARTLPEVRTAVFSGVDKGPDQPLDHAEGEPIGTLWGYLAWHLAGRDGLNLVRSSEEAGTNPGAEIIQKVLELTGAPSLVLLDELVVFIRQLSGERFEAHLSFLQSLTEAASQVPNALIVGSLPESEIEAGQEQGREALRRLEKLFGRVQSAWEPAQGTETYAVVRRRLFQELDEAGERERKRTIERFRKLYRDNQSDFPAAVSKPEYLDKMMDAYPVHPMLFDILSDDWGPLEKFQRTRGVLSLIARAIYASYMDQSDEPLILPSSMRMDDPSVKGALIEPLDGAAWSSIVDGEVDGDRSLTWDMEKRRPRYGRSAIARRAARSVFLATAPGDGAKSGMTGQELRLACTKPGEQFSVFGDALRELTERSAHLYQAEGRYWYGPKPTLNKVAQQREGDIDDEKADEAIVALLRQDGQTKGKWSRVHVAPDRALEANDERSSGLVILGPSHPFDESGSGAIAEARDGLERRSGGQRRFRNSVLFLAADAKSIEECRRLSKRALAWRGVVQDESLELLPSQRKDAEESARRSELSLRDQVRKSWSNLLVPEVDPQQPGKPTITKISRRQTGQKSLPEAAWQIAENEGCLVEKLGARTLSDRVLGLWQEDQELLDVDKVRDWYFEHLHMDRVRDESVIADAIADAAAIISDPPFGIATLAGTSELKDCTISTLTQVRFGNGMVLVRPEVAIKKIEGQTEKDKDRDLDSGDDDASEAENEKESSGAKKPTNFSAVISLDTTKGAITAAQVFEAIVSELERAKGAEINVTLEVSATSTDGFDADTVEIVEDNADTIGFVHKRFS